MRRTLNLRRGADGLPSELFSAPESDLTVSAIGRRAQIDALAAAITAIDTEVERDLGPFHEAVALLATIPGVGQLTAEVILSEIGLDMSRFPTAGHLLSWAGLCPRQHESRRQAPLHPPEEGAPWLKTALSKPPGPRCARSTATSRPSSSACAPAAAPERPSAPSPHPCSPPLTTCSPTAPSTPIPARPLPQERAHHPSESPRKADRAPRLQMLNRGTSFYLEPRRSSTAAALRSRCVRSMRPSSRTRPLPS